MRFAKAGASTPALTGHAADRTPPEDEFPPVFDGFWRDLLSETRIRKLASFVRIPLVEAY